MIVFILLSVAANSFTFNKSVLKGKTQYKIIKPIFLSNEVDESSFNYDYDPVSQTNNNLVYPAIPLTSFKNRLIKQSLSVSAAGLFFASKSIANDRIAVNPQPIDSERFTIGSKTENEPLNLCRIVNGMWQV
jgi:hypothetical protein